MITSQQLLEIKKTGKKIKLFSIHGQFEINYVGENNRRGSKAKTIIHSDLHLQDRQKESMEFLLGDTFSSYRGSKAKFYLQRKSQIGK